MATLQGHASGKHLGGTKWKWLAPNDLSFLSPGSESASRHPKQTTVYLTGSMLLTTASAVESGKKLLID